MHVALQTRLEMSEAQGNKSSGMVFFVVTSWNTDENLYCEKVNIETFKLPDG